MRSMRWLTRTHRSLLLIILVALAAHGQMLGRGFVSDDWDWLHIGATAQFPEYVTGNYAGVQGQGGSYRPVITLVMQLMYAGFGLQAFWYHALSLVLLIATAVGIAHLVLLLLAAVRQREWIAWMSALFFVLMPTHAEAVYWVAGLPDMVAAACMVWSTVFMIRSVRTASLQTVVSAFALWIVALGAKENAIVLPGIWAASTVCVAAMEWNREQVKHIWRRLLLVYGSATVVLILFVLLRRFALGSGTLSYSVTAAQLTARAAVTSLLHTATATIVGWHEVRHRIVGWIWEHRAVVAGIGGGVAIAFGAWAFRRHWRTAAAWVALLGAGVVAALPNSVVTFHPVFAEGERFAYFPSVFVAVLLAWLCSVVIEKHHRVGRAGALLIALSFVIAIPQYHRAWDEADQAFAQVSKDLEQATMPSVVVGIPEFAQGIAPVLRNGLPQYYVLAHGRSASPVGRLPFYTQWDDRSPVRWVPDVNGWKATYATSTLLWGPDVYTDEAYLIELWGYQYHEQRGGAMLKFVYRPDDPRTARAQRTDSPRVYAWSSEGFIPMPSVELLK